LVVGSWYRLSSKTWPCVYFLPVDILINHKLQSDPEYTPLPREVT
jgi:hypothetical protein